MKPPLLDIKDITMRFGGLTAVSNFNLKMQQGEIVGLIGPNGAGKSTVYNMITGFYKPTEGTIKFNQRNITGWAPDRIAQAGLIRVFQNGRLFKQLDVIENLLISQHMLIKSSPLDAIFRTPKYSQEENKIVNDSINLLERFDLKQIMHEPAGKLPFGLQRKLEVARALMARPKLLLLDEPATGLSVEEIDEMMKFVLMIKKDYNLTIIVIEHHMQVIMSICPRILVLDHGETIAVGSPEQIQNDQKVIEAYLGVDVNVTN
jgi:branched-chain amino acid transport system ATP-binding protein